MLDLEKLEQLVAFADYGTLSKVAEHFHISTPSVTRSMQEVEEDFGVSLFHRGRNRIELNETGEEAVVAARKLLQEASQTMERVRAFDERRRTLVIKSCAPAPLWELLKKTEAAHPGMTISSGICQNKEVLQCLEQETCDLAILPYAASVQGWKVREFMKEQLFVCVTKEHELAGHTRLFWRDLNGFNFLLRSELGFWDALCKEKMPASRFLVQTEEEVFDELVNASTLPCFTTDYVTDREGRYQNRVNIPIVDTDANITYFLYSKMNKK